VEGIARIAVSSDGRTIRVLEQDGGAGRCAVVEAVLGPALVLALALAGVFCLHASAVMIGEQAMLFLGDSGAGKSTLARLMPVHGGHVTRVTDDLSPVIQGADGRFHLLCDFPQLKLSAAEQFDWRQQASTPIGAIFQLDRRASAFRPVARSRRLAGVEAFRVLARQSVASRLFPATVLRGHTRWIGELLQRIPVAWLTYADGVDQIAAVRGYLQTTRNYADSI
jgi:hypothetical protein